MLALQIFLLKFYVVLVNCVENYASAYKKQTVKQSCMVRAVM